jgi:rRNA maturation RNase YbeY
MVKGTIPHVPFAALKDEILGPAYDVSLVFIGAKRSQELNRIHRKKDKPANILTFPLSKTEGEIFITPSEARKDAAKFERTYRQFIADLFIHGLFHLKGNRHGSTMSTHETRVRKKFHL